MKLVLETVSRYWQIRFLAVGAGVALVVYAVLLPDAGNKSHDASILSVAAAPLSLESAPSGGSSAAPAKAVALAAAAPDGASNKGTDGRLEGPMDGRWLGENRAAAEQLRLAVESYQDAEIPRDYSESIRSLRSAADQGSVAAQFLLGHAYETGFGVPKDLAETGRWYRRASEAQRNDGGDGGIGGSAAKDFAQALDVYRKAAEEGDRGAELYMGLACDTGQDEPRNSSAAVQWYRRAAAQGSASAASNLGILFHEGDGMPRDSVEAAVWFESAAARGSASAQYVLGRMYYKGDGVAQSYRAAAGWLEKAARQGNAPAQVWLSYMYATGLGVAGNTPRAYMWVNLASGSEDQARVSRGLMERVIPQDEISEGQRLTHDWLLQHSEARR